ncbi:AT-rich interactive domain-containing protein 5B-like [Stegostoma tigrinum]|uniref:AT-rich interactive domain-containing protein 5B-like n=1 Tax=Stegostoma tigrinum TaxID=3053191 RepID=UPI00202AF936|nr:AT-rich interactive domain-containing protein 5B-like [Stegostoma tigrinum]
MQCELKELPTGQVENSEMDGEILEVKDMVQGDKGQQNFLVDLYKFMKERGTPIERIPHLGFKQVNLLTLYKAVEKLGGYEAVTTSRLWKNIYDELGGNPGSTSAATCTRRHYERLVLPYERYIKGEEDKPLPTFKPRKPYNVMKNKEGKVSSNEQKERSKRKRPNDNMQQSSETDRMVPQVVSEDVGGDKKKHTSVDKESPFLKNTTTGSEDSNNQPLNILTPQDSCGHKSPNQNAITAAERPTQNRISEEVWDTKDSFSESVSRAVMGNKIVDHNGHCVTVDVSEEIVRGHTANSKDDRTGSHQAPAMSASQDSLPVPLPPEADKSHMAILRHKRDQEIMSPLAKKKFLAQGSEATSLSFNAVGISSSSAAVKSVQGSEPPVSCSPPEASIHRPSVIHHIQPPIQAHLDYRSEWSFNNNLAKYQLYPLDQISSTNGQGAQEERDRKGRAVEHSHPLQCYGNFCCSPYMHGLVKPFLHYPSKGSPFGCCSNQRSFRELNSSAVPTLTTAAYKTARHYDRTLAPHDQPTDLSLPRASSANSPQTQVSWVTETKNSTSPLSKSSFSGHTSPSSSDGRPKACWVPPMSVTLPRRVPAKRAKSAGLLINAKSGPPNCQLAQPTQRTQKELDAAYGKKLRIVSPLHVTKHPDIKESQRICDSKTMSNEQKSSLPEVSTWLPTTLTPQEPTLYDRAGAYLPGNYAHHLSHVKNPALYSPLIPRLTINSFMIPAIQGPVLSSPGHPLDLYKHLTMGTSYENLLHHRLYPNPPLSSFHAGHKL